MTGVASGSTLAIRGSSMSTGSLFRIRATFSRTSWTARSMSRSRINSTVTRESPSVLLDVIVFTPLIVLTAPSILSVMSTSITSGLAPFKCVEIVTIGKSTLGKRSTPISG
jgi:hypothetical protein